MSKRQLRAEKTCLNCGYRVEEQYCPNCGQENIAVKQPFHHLFASFFKSFTSYESQFWKTIGNLLFSPGTLTKEYVQGKRQQYVPPAKLYIFISFFTFFVLSFVGVNTSIQSKDPGQSEVSTQPVNSLEFLRREALARPGLSHEDSLTINRIFSENAPSSYLDNELESMVAHGDLRDLTIGNAHTMEQYDSIMESNASLTRRLFYPFAKKIFEFKEQGLEIKDIAKGFAVVFMKMLPKALFLYLPFLAFILWLFHNKKNWWYFDHGVFTLHYFSFLLLVVAIFMLFNLLDPLLGNYAIYRFINALLLIVAFTYGVLYFFMAYYRFYGNGSLKSLFKALFLFVVNGFTFTFMILSLIGISLLMVN